MTHVLWNSKQESVSSDVIVSLPSSITTAPKFNASFSSNGADYKADALTERLDLYACSSKANLLRFVSKHLSVFQRKDGLALFLYSVVLTHGIESIKADFDDPATTLIGRHGYCTQEMVNLLLTGRAVSNVFDGEMNFGEVYYSCFYLVYLCPSNYTTSFERSYGVV